MSAPGLLVGAGPLFWGWQSDHLVVGALLGLALEGVRRMPLRFDLGTEQHSTVADLSTIGFVLLAALLSINLGISRGVLQAFVWLPAALSPILAAQFVSTQGRIPLSALFRYMRKLKRENPAVHDPMTDVSAVYFALTLLAAGVANQRGPAFYVGTVLGTACLLYAARPRGASLWLGALLIAAAALLGHGGQLGLSQLQAHLEDWMLDFNFRGIDVDPFRTRTEIGSLGRIKLQDQIVMRVYAPEAGLPDRYRLLHRASYNTYVGNTWYARGTVMDTLDSEADNETWNLRPPPAARDWRLRIATRFEANRSMLALPAGTTRIAGFPAYQVRRNALGAVHATLAVDWAQYEAQGGAPIADYAPPGPDDAVLPPVESAVFERVAAELRLREVPQAEALRRIEEHLSGFSYSLYRERRVPADETPLGDFLTRTRAGHCEYFAAAATLLARAAGIPARYANGFAVMEYSTLEKAWLVRARHAHAWSRAWVDGRWVDLDPTPAAWFEEEARDAPAWQGLSDLVRWAAYQWSQRGEFKASDSWYAVLAVLALILAWRVLRGRSAAPKRDAPSGALSRTWPGRDSEFYVLEKTLPPREDTETQGSWLNRIRSQLSEARAAQIRDALRLHQRYRFDPEGLGSAERNQLRELCRMLAPERTT